LVWLFFLKFPDFQSGFFERLDRAIRADDKRCLIRVKRAALYLLFDVGGFARMV